MQGKLPASELIRVYRGYERLLGAVGHSVDRGAVAEHLAEGCLPKEEVEALLNRAGAKAHCDRELPSQVVDRMRELARTLIEEVSRCLDGSAAGTDDLAGAAEALKGRPEAEREAAADAVLLNGHRRFLQPRYVSAEQVHELMRARADGGQLPLGKLLPWLRGELEKRGLSMPEAELRDLLGPAVQDRQVPFCLLPILRRVDGQFSTGLIALREMVGDRDPDEWLEAVRRKLLFRSHSAMHKAIAEATVLKYDCVHKALSGRRKAKRIQAEIKHCLETWQQDVDQGRDPAISEEHRGVSVERMCGLLPALEKKFGTKERTYRRICARTGIKTGSVRRYFQSNGQLKYAPLNVYRCAQQLALEAGVQEARRSYLADSRARRIASELAREAGEALRRWRDGGDNPELEIAYKELRRALIVSIKEGRDAAHVMA